MSPSAGEAVSEPEFLGSEVEVRAWRFASAAHEGQLRKGDGSAYITHPTAVAALTRSHGGDHEQIAAAFLHDVLEDTDIPAAKIVGEFGTDVGSLVSSLSDDRSIDDYPRRKAALREQVEAAGPRAILIYACDKLANARDLRRVYAEHGEAAEERYSAPLDLRIRLWREDLEMAVDRLGRTPLVADLASELDRLEHDRAGRAA